jgi:tRNA(Met) C34 N-acetyltransferase TmcA
VAAESRLVKRWRTIYKECRKDIFALCKYLNFLPTDQQAHILRLIQLERDLPVKQRKKRIAVKSGQGPGKTAVSNIIALWRVLQFPDAMCIITAPTMRQAKKVWLAEFRRMMRQAHPILQKMIKVTKSDVRVGGSDHPEWGIQLATGSKAENVQGFHEKHLTFIVDEASGVERDIIDTIKATLKPRFLDGDDRQPKHQGLCLLRLLHTFPQGMASFHDEC